MSAPIARSWQVLRESFRNRRRYHAALAAKAGRRLLGRYDAQLAGAYFVTTERGVLHLEGGRIRQAFDVPCYGIAFHGDHFYVSAWFGDRTSLMRGQRGALLAGSGALGLEELYGLDVRRSNERIHQIYAGQDGLWIANTGRNTIAQFDWQSGELRLELAPFHDEMGAPVLFDNHHINSVSAYGEVVLFVAYGVGGGSLLCVCEGRRLTGYRYEHMGVHDIFLSEEGELLFCDTFARKCSARDGVVHRGADEIDPEGFRNGGRFPRGLAGDGRELLIGSSFEGQGRERFRGRGQLVVVRAGRVSGTIELPAAQVYQIVSAEGRHVRPPASAPTPDEVRARFEAAFGAAVFESRLSELPADYLPHRAFPGARVKA
ncbi:MAG: hypothetical protein E2O39_00660 [Planctomycetota bacterium]|nr:MAG: hypothetical protein E2O39_00660 [Planctomycetota bacterium]